MIKGLSNIVDRFYMNLHEECLLKYLVNPLELFYTTEMLKNNNLLIEQHFAKKNLALDFENEKFNVGRLS